MPSSPAPTTGNGRSSQTDGATTIGGRVMALLEGLSRPSDIPRGSRIYANRNLQLDRVKLVGFDMDYTLALYDQPRMEAISILATLNKLIGLKDYPEAIRGLTYDARFGIRGLVIDRETGNILKPDRYGSPGRAYHGLKALDSATLFELYHKQRFRFSSERFAFIDTLFALPEAVMYAAMVEFFDAHPALVRPYPQVWDDIRECIDLAHRDGAIKDVIVKDLRSYIQPDPHLAEALHKMRSSGKKLFLLTNSAFDYTNALMSYLLDGALDAYPGWRNYFDVVIVSSQKPGFFTDKRPFHELDAQGNVVGEMGDEPFARGKAYSGGNLISFEERVGARGDRVLFVGDHIYGDMLRSRKSSAWRTAMVIQELEHEVKVHDELIDSLARLEEVERNLRHLDAEVDEKQHILRSLEKLETGQAMRDDVTSAKRLAREVVDRMRGELRASMAEHAELETKLDQAFNVFWGPSFREGREVSKFGDQVDGYACVYTSRASNFRFYSPMRHFRGPRDRMPHER